EITTQEKVSPCARGKAVKTEAVIEPLGKVLDGVPLVGALEERFRQQLPELEIGIAVFTVKPRGRRRLAVENIDPRPFTEDLADDLPDRDQDRRIARVEAD